MLDILFQVQFDGKTYDTKKGWSPFLKALQQTLHDEAFSPEEFLKFSESIRQLIESNYELGKTYTGEPVAPLKESTIKRKGHDRLFFDSGELLGSILLGDIPSGYEVFVKEGRSKIAAYLQEDDTRGSSRRVGRPAFGIEDVKVDELLNFFVNRNN